jgi:hypothetical protein
MRPKSRPYSERDPSTADLRGGGGEEAGAIGRAGGMSKDPEKPLAVGPRGTADHRHSGLKAAPPSFEGVKRMHHTPEGVKTYRHYVLEVEVTDAPREGAYRPARGVDPKRRKRRRRWPAWLAAMAVCHAVGACVASVGHAFLGPVAAYVVPHYLRQWLPEPSRPEQAAPARGPPADGHRRKGE